MPKAKSKMNSAFMYSVKSFSGEFSDIGKFFTEIRDLQTVNEWSDLQTFIFMRGHLEGPANDFFWNSDECKACKNIDDVETLFTEFFYKDLTYEAKAQFQNLRFDQDNLRCTIHKLNSIAAVAFPSFKKNIEALNEVKFQKLLEIVPDNVRMHILSSDITQYEAACEAAIKNQMCAEKCLNYKNNNYKSNDNKFHSNNPDFANAINVNEISKPSTSGYKSNHSRNVKQKDSSSNVQTPKSQYNGREYPYKRKQMVKCQLCFKFGHTANNCYKWCGYGNKNNFRRQDKYKRNNYNNIPKNDRSLN